MVPERDRGDLQVITVRQDVGDIGALTVAVQLMHENVAIHVGQHKPLVAAPHDHANR